MTTILSELARVVVRAPVRVADVGGWTDTWFGAPGRVCSLAVGPGVRVEAVLNHTEPDGAHLPVRIVAPDLGENYRMGPAGSLRSPGWHHTVPARHPLLELAVAATVELIGTDLSERAIELYITSAVPPGASLGTSSAVVVTIMAAVDALVGGFGLSGSGLAAVAHRVETERVGREAGVQDHWSAVMGGCGAMLIDPYPDVRHERVDLSEDLVTELSDRLVTVAIGAHDSSAVHAEVIDAVTSMEGPEYERVRAVLAGLSSLATDAAWAIGNGDLDGWGAVLTESVAAQARLHPGLVGPAHLAAIEVAERCGATGWKVNGAGGDGGSLTVLARPEGAAELRAALAAASARWEILELRLAAGLKVTETEPMDGAFPDSDFDLGDD